MLILIDDHKVEIPKDDIKYLSSVQVTMPALSPQTGMQVGEIRVSFDTAVVEEPKAD